MFFRHGLGLAEAARGDTDKFIGISRKLLELDPKNEAPQTNPGNILWHAGAGRDIQGGESAFREAIRLWPELAALHLNLANLLAQSGRPMAARVEFEEAIRIGPPIEIVQAAWYAALARTGSPAATPAAYKDSSAGKHWVSTTIRET